MKTKRWKAPSPSAAIYPSNRRGGELYGADVIAGDALICQERRTSFSVDDLSGFTQEEAEQLRDLLFRRTGGGRG